MTGPPSIDGSLAICLYDINVTRSGVVKVSGRCQSFVGRRDIFFRRFCFATTPNRGRIAIGRPGERGPTVGASGTGKTMEGCAIS